MKILKKKRMNKTIVIRRIVTLNYNHRLIIRKIKIIEGL